MSQNRQKFKKACFYGNPHSRRFNSMSPKNIKNTLLSLLEFKIKVLVGLPFPFCPFKVQFRVMVVFTRKEYSE